MALNSSGDDDHDDLALVLTKQTRVWSEDDEIAILRGLAAYRADTHGSGVVPSSLSDMDAFLPFIRSSLEIKEGEEEVNSTQLIDKIRRLRNKYRAVRLRCRDRRHLSFINPHDETLYHLSSKVWGDSRSANEAGVEEETTSGGEGDAEEEALDKDTTTSVHPHSSPRRRHSSRINVTTNPPPPAKEKQHQRVWSDEDEIAILCGLADYCAETGTIPSGLSHMDSFLAFIRKSLHIKEEVKKTQLNDKVRHLREKYQALRRRGRGGRRLSFNNTHDELLYHLSRRVWGAAEDGNASNDAAANGNATAVANKKLRKRAEENGDAPPDNNANAAAEKKNQRKRRRTKTKEVEAEVEENGDACAGETTKTKKKNTKEEEEGAPSNQDPARVIKRKVSYPLLMDAITRAGMMTNSDAVKRGLELADLSKAQVLEERWKRLRLLEMKNHLRRASLIEETVKLSLKSLENEG